MSSVPNTAFELLREVARQTGATVRALNDATMEVDVAVVYADEFQDFYHLEFIGEGDSIKVREREPEHLPAFCPERHINPNGTFCLSWDEDETLQVTDLANAQHFWTVLLGFLVRQRRAKRNRKWPGEAWAHGGAAEHQKAAEAAAAELGETYSSALAKGEIVVKLGPTMNKANGAPLRVYVAGRFEYAVWSKARRVANSRQPCICSQNKDRRAKMLRSCGAHAAAAANLALSVWSWIDAEQKYWKQLEDKQCCQTCDGCPLAVASPRNLSTVQHRSKSRLYKD